MPHERIMGAQRRRSGVARGPPQSARGPGGGGAARAAAKLQMQRSPRQEVEPTPDYRRRNTMLNEQRLSQGRWPPEARWAGHPPEFLREKFEKLGTLANERGDGRKLPSERGEVWYW